MPLLTRFKPDLLLVVGDHRQLPPYSDCDNFSPISVLERMAAALCGSNPLKMLKAQYRMHPDICRIVSTHFYGGELTTALETARRRSLTSPRSIEWYAHETNEECDEAASKLNREECRIVCDQILPRLEEEISRGKTVAIITFYKAQVRLLQETLEKKGLLRRSVSVISVDASQGSEADISILSMGKKSLSCFCAMFLRSLLEGYA